MAEKDKKVLQPESTEKTSAEETALMIEGLYNGILGGLKKIKSDICNELRYSSLQISSSCEKTQKDASQMVAKNQATVQAICKEIKYGYQQNEAFREDFVKRLEEIFSKFDSAEGKLAAIEEIISTYERVDYSKLTEIVEATLLKNESYLLEQAQEIVDKASVTVAEQNQRVLDAVAGIELPEGVDYARIAGEVGERVKAIFEETASLKETEEAPACNYEALVDEIVAKVVEALPYEEKIDYKQVEEIVGASALDGAILSEEIAEKVIEKLSVTELIDYERLAETVVAKMPAPAEPEAIDYDLLSDMIVAKMPKAEELDYDSLADVVTAKLAAAEEGKEKAYDVVLDEEGIEKITCGVLGKLDLDTIAEKVAAKIVPAEPEEIDYDLLADMVADRLADKFEVYVEEEVIEEPEEEPVCEECEEAPVEETIEEVDESVEEIEETEEEEPVVEEVAAAKYEESGNELIDADTGLVVRLKRSFTAKLKQSDEDVKVYYDQIKNELISYKKIKSTVSWHGDRFNLGRNTIAKMNICGKTLCFYIALDPEDPELKTSVYHQKNVGDQKAYQATPFKVKVKSDMGAKRAIRLVKILAAKMEAVKKPEYTPTDYVEEFNYETTKELLEQGLIKETKEKKNAFKF